MSRKLEQQLKETLTGRMKKMRFVFILKLAMKSIWSRKLRSLITVGGVILGIGAIVFLVSLGYGLQDLVTEQVTGINALRIIDVASEKSAVLKINDESLNNFAGIGDVEQVVPVINTAGKLKVGTSVIDGVIYGADKRYTVEDAIEHLLPAVLHACFEEQAQQVDQTKCCNDANHVSSIFR